MRKLAHITSISVIIFMLIGIHPLHAQYIIEQIEYEIPVSYELIPEDIEFENPEDEAMFFLNLPENDLKKSAIAEGRELQIEKSTIYLDGENIAVENDSEEMRKTTMISNSSTGKIYSVLWSQKKVIEFSQEEMNKMQEKSQAFADEMLKNLTPEMRKQIEEEMQKESKKVPVKYTAESTGKKSKKYGFDCEQYIVNKDEEIISIWATSDNLGISKEVRRLTEKFNEIFKSDDGEDIDEWELVAGKIPVEIRTFSSSMMHEPILVIQAITKIENKKPSPGIFKVPDEKDGFSKGSMMDMMNQMMPENND